VSDLNRISVEKQQTSPIRVGQVYKSSLLANDEANFQNKAMNDPSKRYFDRLAGMLDQGMIKAILAGFIKDSNASLYKSRSLAGSN
jgi:hypothetical protein